MTTSLCAGMLRTTPGSLIVTVFMEVGSRHQAAHGVAYSVAKAADDRLALAVAAARSADGVASIALYPGLVRTEGVMQFAEHLDLAGSESPQGVGRVVAAPSADDEVMALTGRPLTVKDLGRRYAIDPAT
ncbi:MAG: hypothetical protein M3Z75_03305 [Actinomycetota bacterium]|nr:hypothetical protein [Actinomycetota bacterium]